MERERQSPSRPLNPTARRWLVLQLAGGLVTLAGILLTVYALAERQRRALPLDVPPSAWLLLAGLAVHFAGRIGARRARA